MEHPLRKRMKRRKATDGIRFLTFSCYRRLPLLGTPSARDDLAAMLEASHRKFRYITIAWVIMPEHVHLLIKPTPGDDDIVRPLTWLKRMFAKQVIGAWRALNAPQLANILTPAGNPQFWQDGGGYDRNIFSNDELVEKTNYIHRNPCTRKLVEHPIDWRWSSARWYLGIRDGIVTVDQAAWPVNDSPPNWWHGEGSRPPVGLIE